MLTEQLVNRIFSWRPYRDDWTVDRDMVEDNIQSYYGELINDLINSPSFDSYYSENGGIGNYLEFFCYPKGQNNYTGFAILVCVSLCAPIAAYGQMTLHKRIDSISWSGLFSPDKMFEITDISLTSIENEIKTILRRHNLSLLDKEFASKRLPDNVIDALKNENHNDGDQYLHGIFQKTD